MSSSKPIHVRSSGAARMAVCLLGVLVSPLLASPASAVTYSWAHPKPQGNPIHDFAFVDDFTGYAVGERGSVLRTTDGGDTWDLVSDVNELTADLYAVRALPDGALLAAGSAPGLFRSTDSGASWQAVPHPATGALFTLDRDPSGRLDAAGEDGVALRSSDDGANWTSIGPGVGSIAAQAWLSDQLGFAVGEDVVHRTTDGGATWSQMFQFNFFGYRDVYFVDATHGFVVADFEYWRTTDAGASWTQVSSPVPPLYRHETLVVDSLHWWTITHLEGAELWETTDGGVVWTQRLRTEALGFQAIARLANGRMLVGSTIGDLFHADDGVTFTNATKNLDNGKPATIISMGSTPGGTLYAVNRRTSGEDETWMRSDDGGRSWFLPPASPDLNRVNDMCFPDEMHGLVAAGTVIRRTTDGGASWSTTALPNGYGVWDFELTGDAIYVGASLTGGGGTVFRSTDDGGSWELRGSGIPGSAAVRSVQFLDDQHGFAAGYISSSPALYRTTDAGASWLPVSTAGLPGGIVTTHWFDDQVGLTAFNGWGIYRTTNAGVSWTQVSVDSAMRLDFRDDLHGYATTTNFFPVAQETTDGGATWTPLVSPLADPSFLMTTADGFVLGGADTRIVHASDLDPASAPIVETSVGGMALDAFPNPAASSITLTWEHPTTLPVAIDVHAANGRLVRRWIRDSDDAGPRLTWDACDADGRLVPAGAYFIRITDGVRAASGRVVVVR